VAIPSEFRGEMAMAGEWKTVSEKSLALKVKMEEEDVKLDSLSTGVRKRKFEGQEEAEEAGETVVRKGWGSTFKSYPGGKGAGDDIEALLGGVAPVKAETAMEQLVIKREESADVGADATVSDVLGANIETKPDVPEATTVEAPRTGIVFKKRKGKKT